MEKKCKHCAMMVPEEALVCPHCRKRLRQSTTVRVILGGVVFLFIIGLIQTSNDKTAPTTTTGSAPTTRTTKSTPEARKAFAKNYERELLNLGADAYVTTEGKTNTTLRIEHILMNRPRVHKLANSESSMATMRGLGFKKVIMTDGRGSSWSIDVN